MPLFLAQEGALGILPLRDYWDSCSLLYSLAGYGLCAENETWLNRPGVSGYWRVRELGWDLCMQAN